MESIDGINSIDLESSSMTNTKNADTSICEKDDRLGQLATPEGLRAQNSKYGKIDKERKIGHRRVGEGGEITYKKIQTSQIMGSIQLGIQHTVGSLASKPKRDLLMMDFWEIESISFPPEGSSLTPAHHYSEFRFKIYAPIAFRYFRDLFGIQPDDFMMSMCSSPLRELSNPGASGSIFYLTDDDEFIIKTVQHKEGEFLQKLLPGYYMNLNQNPRTLLPKFFGLYCFQCNSKNVRLIVMNNLLPSYVKMHLKYDLKGSTYKRKASKAERSKKSPTFKDLDFMEHHPNGILLEAETYNALIKTIQRDCTVLESFKIMDYSLLVGVHNLDLSSKEKQSARQSNQKANLPKTTEDSDLEDAPEADQCIAMDGRGESSGINRNRSVNKQRLVAHSTAMESIQAESEPIDDEDDVPPGGIPARSEKGERLLLFIGIIDILQSYRLKKKLEHTFKAIIHDGETVSVCRPSFYAQRFQNFMAKQVFRKIPSLDLPEIKGNHRKFRTLVSSYIALKHSPSKRKSLSRVIQKSIESETESRSASNTAGLSQISSTQPLKPASRSTAITSNPIGIQSKQKPTSASTSLKPKVPPPVPPRGSPRNKKGEQTRQPSKVLTQSTLDDQSSSASLQQHRASSTGRPILNYANKPQKLDHQYLQAPPIPRFGDRRSPSNVQDWLELHDLFDVDDDMLNNNKPKITSKPIAVVPSDKSVMSNVQHHHQVLNRIDLFKKRNSIMSHSYMSTTGSIVRSFPPIKPENPTPQPQRQPQQVPRKVHATKKQREKQQKYFQYADMAFGDDDGQEENILQTLNSFIEVKRELENNPRARRVIPNLQPIENERKISIVSNKNSDSVNQLKYRYQPTTVSNQYEYNNRQDYRNKNFSKSPNSKFAKTREKWEMQSRNSLAFSTASSGRMM